MSNLGTWVHEVGAGWLMSTLDDTPEMVSLVRTAMATPIMLLAIPAGVLADRFDRRILLILTQLLLLATASTLAVLTKSQVMTPWLLLALTFVMGIGFVLHVPDVAGFDSRIGAATPTLKRGRTRQCEFQPSAGRRSGRRWIFNCIDWDLGSVCDQRIFVCGRFDCFVLLAAGATRILSWPIFWIVTFAWRSLCDR